MGVWTNACACWDSAVAGRRLGWALSARLAGSGELEATEEPSCRSDRLSKGYGYIEASDKELVRDLSDAGRYESVVGYAPRPAVAVRPRQRRSRVRVGVTQDRLDTLSSALCCQVPVVKFRYPCSSAAPCASSLVGW